MPFPLQKGKPNCGAYALAYYTWLTQEYTPAAPPPVDTAAEPKLVNDIYNSIQFGGLFNNDDYAYILDTTPANVPPEIQQGFPLYSNPAKIILLLRNGELGIPKHSGATFCKGTNSDIAKLFDRIKAVIPSSDATRPIIESAQPDPLPIPKAGQYAIALFSVEGMEGILGIHYVLIRGKADGKYEAINSWDGDFVPVEGNVFESDDQQLIFLGAGIKL